MLGRKLKPQNTEKLLSASKAVVPTSRVNELITPNYVMEKGVGTVPCR